MKKTYYAQGDANAICDVCGFEFKHSQLRKRWDGAMVCSDDYETRHPQDFLRAGRVSRPVRNARPEGEDVFLEPGDVTKDDL